MDPSNDFDKTMETFHDIFSELHQTLRPLLGARLAGIALEHHCSQIERDDHRARRLDLQTEHDRDELIQAARSNAFDCDSVSLFESETEGESEHADTNSDLCRESRYVFAIEVLDKATPETEVETASEIETVATSEHEEWTTIQYLPAREAALRTPHTVGIDIVLEIMNRCEQGREDLERFSDASDDYQRGMRTANKLVEQQIRQLAENRIDYLATLGVDAELRKRMGYYEIGIPSSNRDEQSEREPNFEPECEVDREVDSPFTSESSDVDLTLDTDRESEL